MDSQSSPPAATRVIDPQLQWLADVCQWKYQLYQAREAYSVAQVSHTSQLL